MANTTEFMTAAEIVTEVVPHSSFDTTLIANEIISAQRKHVREFLGEDYYEDLLDKVENSTMNAADTTLMDEYIKPMLARYVLFEALPQVRLNLTSQGVMINDTEFSNQSSHKDWSMLRSKYLNDAEFWREDAIRFIKDEQDDDSTKYPLWCDESTDRTRPGIIIY